MRKTLETLIEAKIGEKRLKILVIINGWITRISGGEVHIFNVTSWWIKKHNVKVKYLMPELGYKYIRDSLPSESIIVTGNVEKMLIKEINKINNNILFALLVSILYLYRIIKSTASMLKYNNKKFDVIISSSHYLYDLIPTIIIGKKFGSKIIIYIHGIRLTKMWKLSFKDLLAMLNEMISLWLIKRYADLIFTINPYIKNYLIQRGFNQNKIYITSNGIDNKILFIGKRLSTDIKFDGCFCGRLVRDKGIYDLLFSWKKVVKYIPQAKLAFIGDGPEFNNLAKKIKELNLDRNVILLGFLVEEEKIKTLKSCKLLLLPSYYEGWSIVIGEALALGVPVIAYDLPELKYIWKNSVIWVNKGNIDELADTTLKLLKDYSIMRREHAIRRNFKFIEELTWDKIAEKQLNVIYKELT